MDDFRFKKFKVYRDAKQLHAFVVKTIDPLWRKHSYLADQIRRASLSIVLNIAEGSGKRSDKDFNRFLENALGSTHEVAAGFDIAQSEGLISPVIEQEAMILLQSIKNQLGGLSKKLLKDL